jgi:hypothetical protein
MNQSIEIAPPNSFVVISDIAGGEIPPRTDARGIRVVDHDDERGFFLRD